MLGAYGVSAGEEGAEPGGCSPAPNELIKSKPKRPQEGLRAEHRSVEYTNT